MNNKSVNKIAVFIIAYLIIMAILFVIDVVLLASFNLILRMDYDSFIVHDIIKKLFCFVSCIEVVAVPFPLYRSVNKFYIERDK